MTMKVALDGHPAAGGVIVMAAAADILCAVPAQTMSIWIGRLWNCRA
jgi:hypothetical protein